MVKNLTTAKALRTKQGPDGSETMKRRVPKDPSLRPKVFEFDPKKAYTLEQLSEIGAIALRWNQIEAQLDFVGSFILFAKTPIWLRISIEKELSTNSKITLLKESLSHSTLLNSDARSCIEDCFAQIQKARGYRNAIVHHHIYDHKNGIGAFVDHSSSAYQILVSIDALKALYATLGILQEELRVIDLLFRIEMDAQRPGRWNKVTGTFEALSAAELTNDIIPPHITRLRALQRSRRECYRLPKFPDADLLREINERNTSSPS